MRDSKPDGIAPRDMSVRVFAINAHVTGAFGQTEIGMCEIALLRMDGITRTDVCLQ